MISKAHYNKLMNFGFLLVSLSGIIIVSYFLIYGAQNNLPFYIYFKKIIGTLYTTGVTSILLALYSTNFIIPGTKEEVLAK